MKLLFLSKRRPQGRDLCSRPYGRFYHIPKLLAQAGAEVHLVLASYRDEPGFVTEQDGMTLYSRKMPPNLPGFSRWVNQLSRNIRPDAVIGLSDTWFGILAASAAAASGSSLVIDAYDNYEAYIPRAKPLHWLWRRALGKAEGLTAAGPQLLELMRRSNRSARHAVVEMAADPLFRPMPTGTARHILELPEHRKLMGYLGTADRTRGFDQFQQGLELLKGYREDFSLVMSGRSDVAIDLPSDRLHRLGYVADDLMPALFNSCDLLVCINRDSVFGNYSYPVKIYEALACNKTVLASDTPPARWILQDDDRRLAKVGNAAELAARMNRLLDHPVATGDRPGGWERPAESFRALLEQIKS